METCRHYRYRLPRELSDELRDADPLPCDVCDALPHRQGKANVAQQNLRAINSIPAGSVSESRQPLATTHRFSTADKTASNSGDHGLRNWFNRLQSAFHPHHS